MILVERELGAAAGTSPEARRLLLELEQCGRTAIDWSLIWAEQDVWVKLRHALKEMEANHG